MFSMNPQRGVVLLLVSGFLVLLAILGMALFGISRSGAAGASASIRVRQARLAAMSGMEYAAARLFRTGLPVDHRDPESRGDDWTYRDSPDVDLRASLNPSFSHGEPWLNDSTGIPDGVDNDTDLLVDEADEVDRIYAAADGAFADRDGDGRFTAVSGRLRGGGGAPGAGGLSFTLRIESPEGKLPVNAGALWAGDLLGQPSPAFDQDEDDYVPIPDHCDPKIRYHRGLIHALDNLGAVLHERVPPLLSTRCEDVAAANPSEPIRISWLGEDLITRRPLGGYRSVEEIRRALLPLGYSSAEIDAVASHIHLGPYQPLGEGGRCSAGGGDPVNGGEGANLPAYVPVNLWCASRTVLECLFRYVVAGSAVEEDSPQNIRLPFPGEALGWVQVNIRSGLPYFRLATPAMTTLVIYPDEAAALAGRIVVLRDYGKPMTWRNLCEDFQDAAAEMFQRDAADLSAFPIARRNWTQAKGQAAYEALTIDPYPYPSAAGPSAWAVPWDVVEDLDNPPPPRPIVGAFWLSRVLYPDGGYGDADPWGALGSSAPYKIPGDVIKPQGGTMAPPVLFDVESFGRVASEGSKGAALTLAGRLQAAERLELTCQEDFENLSGAPRLARRGIGVRDIPVPGLRRAESVDPDSSRSYPAVASLPRWSRWSLGTLDEKGAYAGFSRNCGALALSPRQAGLGGALIYWPFAEQFDGDASTDAASVRKPAVADPGPYPLTWAISNNPEYVDSADANPYGVSTASSLDLQGLSGPSGPFATAHSAEFWAVPGSMFVWKHGDNDLQLEVDHSVNALTPNAAFKLTASWDPAPMVGTWRVNDAWPPAWCYHVVLSWACGTEMKFTLYVNGSEVEFPAGAPVTRISAPPSLNGQELLKVKRLDEVRLYAESVDSSVALAGAQAGRFARTGTYLSPLYVLAGGIRLGRAQWTGVIPAGFEDNAGNGVDPFTVRIQPYRTEDASDAAPPAPCTLGDSDLRTQEDDQSVYDLSLAEGVKSFRFTVGFDCSQVATFKDTPVFESIWITFQRQGGHPAWIGWTER